MRVCFAGNRYKYSVLIEARNICVDGRVTDVGESFSLSILLHQLAAKPYCCWCLFKMAESLAPAMVITMITCTAISLVFMCLRFFSKHLVSTKLGVDDAVLVFSWVCLLNDLCSNERERHGLTLESCSSYYFSSSSLYRYTRPSLGWAVTWRMQTNYSYRTFCICYPSVNSSPSYRLQCPSRLLS